MSRQRREQIGILLALTCAGLAGCANPGASGRSIRAPALAPPMLGSEAPLLQPLPENGPPFWLSRTPDEPDEIQTVGYVGGGSAVALGAPRPTAIEPASYESNVVPADDLPILPTDPEDPQIIEVTPPLVIGSSEEFVAGACAECGGDALLCSERCISKHKAKKLQKKADRSLMKSLGIIKTREQRREKRDIGSNPLFPRELRMASHPLYVVEPPDVLYIEAVQGLPERPIFGERLIRQDGTISLGYYGQIHVAGLTLAEVEEKIRQRLGEYVQQPEVYVDVSSFNSKVYYVLGQVQQVGRLPITGKETVLDGITLAGGLTNYANKRKIHLARPNPGGGCDQYLYVDYDAIVNCGDTRTNYQLMPGDRIVVPSTRGYRVSVLFENIMPPFERIANLFSLIRFATD